MLQRVFLCLLMFCAFPSFAAPVELTDGASIAWDASQGSVFHVTIHGNRYLQTPSNLADCAEYTLLVDQDSTGGRLLSYAEAGYQFPAGARPELATAPGSRTIIKFYSDGAKLVPTVVTRQPMFAPGAPSNLVTTPGTGQVSLAWADNSAFESGYRIQRWDGVMWQTLGAGDEPANTVTYVDTVAPSTYDYRVLAVKDGVTSDPSNVAAGTSN